MALILWLIFLNVQWNDLFSGMIMVDKDIKVTVFCGNCEFVKCSIKEVFCWDSLHGEICVCSFLFYQCYDFGHDLRLGCDCKQILFKLNFLYTFQWNLVWVGFNVDFSSSQVLSQSNFEESFVQESKSKRFKSSPKERCIGIDFMWVIQEAENHP